MNSFFSLRHLACLLVVLFVISGPAYAQNQEPCGEILQFAERYYQQNRIEEAIALLSDCLRDEDISRSTAVKGYRLLALAYLRNDELGEARLAVIELLGYDRDYRADSINDLPAYVALVGSTREQLGLNNAQPTPVDPPQNGDPVDPPLDRYVASQLEEGFLLKLRLGISHYGGERGTDTDSFISEFGDNANISMEIGLDYAFTKNVSVGMFYLPGRYVDLTAEKGRPPAYPIIDEETSSKWIHMLGVISQAGYFFNDNLSMFGKGGLAVGFGKINDEITVGLGPRIGLGIAYDTDSDVSLFLELDSVFMGPDSAFDLVELESGFDIFTSVGVGTRIRL